MLTMALVAQGPRLQAPRAREQKGDCTRDKTLQVGYSSVWLIHSTLTSIAHSLFLSIDNTGYEPSR